MIKEHEQAIYDTMVEYQASKREQADWHDTLFKLLAIESLSRTPDEKKIIAEVLKIIRF